MFRRFVSHKFGFLASQIDPCPFLIFSQHLLLFQHSLACHITSLILQHMGCNTLFFLQGCNAADESINFSGSVTPRTTCSYHGLHVQNLQGLRDLRAGVDLAVHAHQEGPVQQHCCVLWKRERHSEDWLEGNPPTTTG